jgi:hypothetical protein
VWRSGRLHFRGEIATLVGSRAGACAAAAGDLLELSKIESREASFKLTNVDVGRLVETLILGPWWGGGGR